MGGMDAKFAVELALGLVAAQDRNDNFGLEVRAVATTTGGRVLSGLGHRILNLAGGPKNRGQLGGAHCS